MVVVAGLLAGLLALPAWAQQTAMPKQKVDQGPFARMTPDQLAAVKALTVKFHQDRQALHADLKTAAEALKASRASGADEAATSAQHEVVKQKVEAIKARSEQFLSDLKPLVPDDLYNVMALGLEHRMKALAARFAEHHEVAKDAQGNTPAKNE